MLYYILGVITGIIISIFNVLFIKKDMHTKIEKWITPNKKAQIVPLTDPINEIDLS